MRPTRFRDQRAAMSASSPGKAAGRARGLLKSNHNEFLVACTFPGTRYALTRATYGAACDSRGCRKSGRIIYCVQLLCEVDPTLSSAGYGTNL